MHADVVTYMYRDNCTDDIRLGHMVSERGQYRMISVLSVDVITCIGDVHCEMASIMAGGVPLR